MKKDATTSPLEGVLVEIFKGLSPEHKGKLLGVAEELRLVEVTPQKASKKRTSKKVGAAPQESGGG